MWIPRHFTALRIILLPDTNPLEVPYFSEHHDVVVADEGQSIAVQRIDAMKCIQLLIMHARMLRKIFYVFDSIGS